MGKILGPVIVLFLGATLGACLTPPAVIAGTYVDAALAIQLYPEGTEHVEIPVGDGENLRGLFVPAGDGAAVVLHLLESSGTPASLEFHYEVLCHQLQDLGLASLIVDYTGVGSSDGKRSPRNLARDANAMWGEAVARAGGDPQRVIVRGISLGTLAAALLLQDGAAPGAVLLHVPVFPDTATRRFARRQRGALVAWFANLIFADLADVDVVREIERCQASLLVVAGSKDFFLTDEDRARLEQAVQAAGGEWHSPAIGHARGTIEAHALRGEEFALLVENYPIPALDDSETDALLASLATKAGTEVAARLAEPGARARFNELARLARHADPVLLAAVSLANEPQLDLVRYVWMLDEQGGLGELPFEDLVEVVSLGGPAGRLPIELIAEASLFGDLHDRFGGAYVTESIGTVLSRVAAAKGGVDGRSTFTITLSWDSAEIVSDPQDLISQLRASGFAEEALGREAVRTLLKGGRTPERVRTLADGRVVLEYLKKGTWTELDLDPGIMSSSHTIFMPSPLGRRARALLEAQAESTPPQEE